MSKSITISTNVAAKAGFKTAIMAAQGHRIGRAPSSKVRGKTYSGRGASSSSHAMCRGEVR